MRGDETRYSLSNVEAIHTGTRGTIGITRGQLTVGLALEGENERERGFLTFGLDDLHSSLPLLLLPTAGPSSGISWPLRQTSASSTLRALMGSEVES